MPSGKLPDVAAADALARDREALELIRQGGIGRRQGVSRLYEGYYHLFVGFFRRHRLSQSEAEDLAQTAFVNIVRACDSFRGEARLDTWLWAIARNTLMSFFRQRQPNLSIDDDDWQPDGDGMAALQTEAPAIRELEDCVRAAYRLFEAAEPARAANLALLVLYGWEIDEIAAVVGRTNAATREYLSQCRKRLRPFLENCRELLDT